MTLPFDNSYARLPARFYVRQPPVPVAAPRSLALNRDLAARLGLDADWLSGPEGLAMLAGNAVPEGAEPLAQAYAGHQFGNFVPQLGDGRALLLGEIVAPDGARFDIQLKGAGLTAFSRRGDGRAWLGPVIREYIVSEAMAALGVPTTRALAATATGESVFREGAVPGAVLTRVASSHIRVGTFQFFAARGDLEGLRLLTEHTLARHYPEAEDAMGLLRGVIDRQARLIAAWMSLGFIHGVMNTDNMTVSGETIDYGPCAFMDGYHPQTVFSSIDERGRYAYANQPQIALWNLAQLATALLPLIADSRDAAIDLAETALGAFPDAYQAEWLARFRAKIGIATAEDGDLDLIERLLTLMARDRADFTRTFRGLARGTARDEFLDREGFDAWAAEWRARLAREADPEARMRGANPALIPRNHRVEQAIRAAVHGDDNSFHRLNAALAHPFVDRAEYADLEAAPVEDERVRRTYCGT